MPENIVISLIRYICLVIFVLVQGAFNEDIVIKQRTELHPAAEFSRHTLVKPKIYHGREKRQILTTNQESGDHINHLQITLEIYEENLVLDLTLNTRLISKGFFQKHQENGNHIEYKLTKEEVNHCDYNGKVLGKPNSWAAISTCDGLSGVIFDGQEMHYIEKDIRIVNSSVKMDHFIYKHSDLVEDNKTCGYAGEAADHKHKHSTTDNSFHRNKRSTESREPIRRPYNANKESKYVELVLVVDKSNFRELGDSKIKVINHCKKIANIINAIYAPLNIFIALVGVVIWSQHDEIILSPDSETTLTNFLDYRREHLLLKHPNDNAQLLTKFTFNNGVIGKAKKGPICTYQSSGGINTDYSPVVGLVAATIAHEMGHNFGMEHDKAECECANQYCIMAPSLTTVAPTHWSLCSLNNLLLAFTHGMDYCLRNKPEFIFDGPVCGNGFVESGEECDCGLPGHCDNTCCDATTCMLYSNASCASGECCELRTCKPKKAGSLCRSADYECDLPEYCTGQSEYCPDDIYKRDTEICDDGKAYCYQGSCRTRTDQCKLLWGETGKSSDDLCYFRNKKGDEFGNCGYDKFKQLYFRCDSGNVLCGMLQCEHLNEHLEFGIEVAAILRHSYLVDKHGIIINCKSAMIDLGTNQIDPGLTPNGAKCGKGKMCLNQKCRNVLSLRKRFPTCEKDCNGRGWCNSKGHCHCKNGFAPPSCAYPGPGGSEDSGPASDPNAGQGLVAFMSIIFFGVLLILALTVFLIYVIFSLNLRWKKLHCTCTRAVSEQVTENRQMNESLVATTNGDSFVRSNIITDDLRNNTEANSCNSNPAINKKMYYTKPPPPVPIIAATSPRRLSLKSLKSITLNANNVLRKNGPHSIFKHNRESYSHLKESSDNLSEKMDDRSQVHSQFDENVNQNAESNLSVKHIANKFNKS